ncbi:hypothetical protein DMC47_37365 [Nostoc sp. 3335mG]|nr:hypothetical protein DMC47_37365 [Nostoc sp. 3335mG]
MPDMPAPMMMTFSAEGEGAADDPAIASLEQDLMTRRPISGMLWPEYLAGGSAAVQDQLLSDQCSIVISSSGMDDRSNRQAA